MNLELQQALADAIQNAEENKGEYTFESDELEIYFYGQVNEESCMKLGQTLLALDKQAKHQKINNPKDWKANLSLTV